MLEHGCRKDHWNTWVAGPISKLRLLNEKIYGHCATKLTPADLPSAFSDNRIITEPLAFASLKDIAKFYDENGVTPEIVDKFLEDGAASPHVLVEMLRARQLAEAAKVPDIIDMIKDARAEGYSVAVFVNFVDTVKTLSGAFMPECSVIVGGQSAEERERNVQAFQRNENRIVICNIAAGGAGVSLHDVEGGHPRLSLVSPTFDVKSYIQTLGRIHRVGAKTPATQKILIASGTIEEKILKAMEQKRIAMETLHQKEQ
jgi:superfamily II DNA or RNA helicase